MLEDEYWKLILDGVATAEACRQLGIGRKTGYRWRVEAGGLPPARIAEEVRSSRYLSLLERQRIATLRELVKAKLEDTWSPQQISNWLRTEHPDRPEWHLCHETIYQALYFGRKGGLSRALTANLRTGRPLRKRRRKATERTIRFVAPAILIHHRPESVETRTRIGEWEGDLIVGKSSRSAIGTLVDRTSRAVRGGLREALRQILVTRHAVLVSRTKAINELKSLIVVAPEHLRALLRGAPLATQLQRIAALNSPAGATVEHRITVLSLRSIAARIEFLLAQTAERAPELATLVKAHPAGPALLAEPGVGPVVAAQLLVSWSHRGRVRDEAAFASLTGVAPLEASSGQRSRHRLNRGGDRDLNRALHTVAITRLRCHPESRAYESNRTAQGKTQRDVRQSLKRALARRLYRRIEAATRPAKQRTDLDKT